MIPEGTMQVLRFSPGVATGVRTALGHYFLLRANPEPPYLVNGSCRHRGGPLHLGSLDKSGLKVVCPMHLLSTPLATLKRRALPVIVRSDEVVVMVPEEAVPAAPCGVPVVQCRAPNRLCQATP